MNFRQTPTPNTVRRNQQYRLAKLPTINIFFLGKVGKICKITYADSCFCGVIFNDEKADIEVPYNCLEYVGG